MWPALSLVGGLLLATAACAPASRDRTTVVVASGADLESANPLVTVHPLARQVQRYALFVTLARYDTALTPQPYLARGWEWSPDNTSLTMHLVPSLRWHDGTPTTARDVAFTIDAARDPVTGFFRRGDLATITATEAPDDSTVVVRFSEPQSRFPLVLCELPIAPVHLLAAVPRAELRTHAFARQPIGNGPYRFVERRARESWTFERDSTFPAELGGPAQIPRLVIAVVDEPTTKFAGLASGDLDLAGISPSMAALTEGDPALALVTYPVAFTNALVFNTTRAPFSDLRVRRALAAAINRQRIVDVALSGLGVAANGPVPPGHPLLAEAAPEPAAAALLDEAGFRLGADGVRQRNGVPLRLTLRTVGSGDNAIEQLVQADLRALGVLAEVQQMELGAFLRDARATDKPFDALITGIPGDVSLSHLAAMFESSQAGGALDYAAYHDTDLDRLFAAARRATTPDDERAQWRAIQQHLAAAAPVAWIYHARGVQGRSRRLHGVQMDLRGELVTLASWSLAP